MAMFSLFADVIVVVHLAFVAFVLLGGLASLRWPRMRWIHLMAAAWAVFVEWSGWRCPLTPLEQWLREQGGSHPYEHDFVSTYLLPLLYPAALTRPDQIVLGGIVVIVNAVVYLWLWHHARARAVPPDDAAP